ncbi:MAG: cytochrome c [Chloroflexi bacterium]|nr:cytochrome c [Chloroflexota bacterium]
MKRRMWVVLILAAFAVGACGGGGEGQSADANGTLAPVPAEYAGKSNPFGADAAGEGAVVFKNNCEACHGPSGRGDGPAGAALDPKPMNLAALQVAAGDDYLFWRINTGKEGTSMLAWKGILTEEQIWQVVAFINTLQE